MTTRKGASQGWNTIFRNAKGSIIVLLDADIEIGENCVSRLSNKISDIVGLCASNTVPKINSTSLYACASIFISYWLRSDKNERPFSIYNYGKSTRLEY